MIVRFLGSLVIALGLLLALVAIAGWFGSNDQIGRNVAIFFGVLAAILLLIGARWRRRRRSTSWRDDPATDRQREFARDLGIKFPKSISKGELSDLIDHAKGK
jgi:hypothetical protein